MRRGLAALVLFACSTSAEEAPVRVRKDAGVAPDVAPPTIPRGTFLGGEAVQGNIATAPITGGTLLATHDSRFVFASNPDYGVVDVVDLEAKKTIWQPRVGDDSEPGRLAEDPTGAVWVVLRRAGAIARLDRTKLTVEKTSVCPAPRGIAATKDEVWVACSGGEIVRVPLGGGSPRTAFVEPDLRDVLVLPDGTLLLTRFRSAELLWIDPVTLGRAPIVKRRMRPPAAWFAGGDALLPHVAWRTLVDASGTIFELHQYESTRIIHSGTTGPTVLDPTSTPYYGSSSVTATPPTAVLPNSLSLVTGAVTRVAEGAASAPDAIVSAIDMALSPSGWVAIGAAMLSDGAPGVVVFKPNAPITSVQRTTGIPVGVAYTPDGHLVMQMRDPPEIQVDSDATRIAISPNVHDTGFAIFHRPTVTGLACMSCHPEGGDDGHTWSFGPRDADEPVDARRTQSIRGGVSATAPFHWAGDMHDLSQLAHDVFTTRMGGEDLTEAQIAVLSRWLDWIPSVPASITDPAAVARGSVVFSGKGGCSACHSGAHFTDNLNHDVGTGALFQTPTLINVALRAPYMHDGCAPTLDARLTDPCAGNVHGNTETLTPAMRSDLVKYLESL